MKYATKLCSTAERLNENEDKANVVLKVIALFSFLKITLIELT